MSRRTSEISNAPSRSVLRAPAGLVLGPLLAFGLIACSGGSAHPAAQPSNSVGRRAAGAAAGQRGPAAFGVAAAISGHTIEVQDPATGQVSVTYTASTKFSQARTTPVSALTAGECVTAFGAGSASSTAFTATTVTVMPPVNGSCARGFGFGGGRPSGSGQPRPSQARPTGAPPSGTGQGGGFGDLANGTLVSISGSTLTVRGTNRSGATTTDTVTVTGATTITETVTTTSAALKVGECVTATGPASSTGTVTASRIALSTAGPNGCTSGFGRRGFGGGAGSGGGSGSGGSGNA